MWREVIFSGFQLGFHQEENGLVDLDIPMNLLLELADIWIIEVRMEVIPKHTFGLAFQSVTDPNFILYTTSKSNCLKMGILASVVSTYCFTAKKL